MVRRLFSPASCPTYEAHSEAVKHVRTILSLILIVSPGKIDCSTTGHSSNHGTPPNFSPFVLTLSGVLLKPASLSAFFASAYDIPVTSGTANVLSPDALAPIMPARTIKTITIRHPGFDFAFFFSHGNPFSRNERQIFYYYAKTPLYPASIG